MCADGFRVLIRFGRIRLFHKRLNSAQEVCLSGSAYLIVNRVLNLLHGFRLIHAVCRRSGRAEYRTGNSGRKERPGILSDNILPCLGHGCFFRVSFGDVFLVQRSNAPLMPVEYPVYRSVQYVVCNFLRTFAQSRFQDRLSCASSLDNSVKKHFRSDMLRERFCQSACKAPSERLPVSVSFFKRILHSSCGCV